MKRTLLFTPFLWITVTAQAQFRPAQRPPFPPQEQTGKASIEGPVLDTITGEPVKKASVMLNGRVGLSAVTDASGHFAFRQLPAGPYNIQVRSDKYPPVQGPLDFDRQLSVSVAADEQKQDIRLSLIPGASVHGRIVDEDGNPMSGCSVAAMQFRDTGMGRTLQQSGNNGQSDDKGEYRISNLPRGKYYVQARCFKTIPLPHAFLRRTSTMNVPTLTYAPLFYPAAADLAGAAKVDASPGADVSGIDFPMSPARGVTVRGHSGPAPTGSNIILTLASRDPAGQWQRRGAQVNASTGEFQIPNVLPGSYELFAIALVEGRSYFAKAPVEVAAEPLEPFDLTLAAAPAISGSISVEGEAKVPLNNMRVAMNSLDGRMIMGPPQAEVQNDGTFILNSVVPGHWRLQVSGLPGYVKSVKQGDREVPPWDLEVGSSAVQLKIVVGTKYAQVEVALSSAAVGSEPISATLWPVNGDPQFQQNFSLNPQGPSRMSIAPGRYYACAFQAAQPWLLTQNSALRKTLEGRCETVEASEGGNARVQVTLIPAADLRQLIEKIEQ